MAGTVNEEHLLNEEEVSEKMDVCQELTRPPAKQDE